METKTLHHLDHSLTYLPPDSLLQRLGARHDADTLGWAVANHELWFPSESDVFTLIDSSKLEYATAEARKNSFDFYRNRPGKVYLAVFGASMAMRAIGILFSKALQLLATRTQMHFFKSEHDARIWLRSQGAKGV